MTPQKLSGFVDAFLDKAANEPDRTYARYETTTLTFGDLNDRSLRLANWMTGRGLVPGDRVAVMMRNSVEQLVTLFALARAGLIWVPVNVQLVGEGLRYVLDHCEPGLILTDPDQHEKALASAAGLAADAIRAVSPEFMAALPAGMAPAATGGFGADDMFAIMYTSGTTGRPKGVEVTHGMLLLAGEAVFQLSNARSGDVFFVWEPLYHIGGAQLLVLPLIDQITLSMVERFSASRFWDQVRARGATHIHYLGGILQILLKQPPSPTDRDHPVRVAWGGGCPKEIWGPFRDRFGVEMRECYGMTEASSITSYNIDGTPGTIGRALPWFHVTIEDADGVPVPPGERGEIVVATSLPGALFRGYWRNPEATAGAIKNGRLHTGDLGSFDASGNLLFHGRLSDNVRCKGENVSAWEVEHIAAQHPSIEDCAMIGVRAEIGEQDIKLFVKPKAGHTVDVKGLSSWLADRLAPYQQPRYFVIVEEFERTPSQRITKHRLSKALDDGWDRLAVEASSA